MSEVKLLDRLQAALKKSKVDDVVGAVIAETPLGKIGRVWKRLSEILGTDENGESVVDAIEAGDYAELAIRMKEFAVRELEAKEETIRNEADNLTARHAADMMGDSKLSKTVRPLVTYILLGAVLLDVLSVRILEANGKAAVPSELLAVLMQMAIGFYFSSRGVQHVIDKLARKWNGRIRE